MGVRDRVEDSCSSASSYWSYKQGEVWGDGCGWEEWGCEERDEVPLAQSFLMRTPARYLDTGLVVVSARRRTPPPLLLLEDQLECFCSTPPPLLLLEDQLECFCLAFHDIHRAM